MGVFLDLEEDDFVCSVEGCRIGDASADVSIWPRTVLSVAKLSGGFLIAKRTFAGQGNFESDR